MYMQCPLLDQYIEYGRKREEKKNEKHILGLLGGKKNKDSFNLSNSKPKRREITPSYAIDSDNEDQPVKK